MDNQYSFLEEAYSLKPLYAELMKSVESFSDINLCPFCIQWGEEFPQERGEGIIFYGRATNGWVTYERDVDKLFDVNFEDCIFGRDDQMQWVDDCAGNQGWYNTNASAFWRVIRKTASKFYPEKTMQHIAWSNVCKIAPDHANPDNSLYEAQLDAARAIMKKELEIFSPKHVVLLTGQGWAKDFLYFLNGNQSTKSIAQYHWGREDEYQVKVYDIGGIYFYLSEHPQGKDESSHIDALVDAIKAH